ncbi:SAM-dependent methyltransferase [Allonocardiopsis opalescens]|uniref:S-adenosyl methyltransferase n=1 Tax=Allonocardiopsis opalescens TaxID=1144618 RepID=A0A2T0QE35_9ACTN|nr:SAM-dependent methyltransferase [Allonocardiopsis opalescens]PRY02197.1 S-adenosyl methyltransferase [Allonocardiopsis opalescens]
MNDDAADWAGRTDGVRSEDVSFGADAGREVQKAAAHRRKAAGRPVDWSTPSPARMYCYYLGGKDYGRADRAAADRAVAAMPELPDLARANRAWLGRTVRYLAGLGIDQFVDVGAGLPAEVNLHESARSAAPDARVVYVDNDPVVLAHGRALLDDGDRTIVVDADLRRPESVLDHPELREVVDLERPVGLICAAVLDGFTDAENPYGMVARLCEGIAPGSHLAVSHIESTPQTRAVAEEYRRSATSSPVVPRSREQIARFFDGLDLVPPGIVPLHQWHPDGGEAQVRAGLCGVARKG